MMKEVTYEGLCFEPYITKDKIDARVAELGKEIVRDCSGKMCPLFFQILKFCLKIRRSHNIFRLIPCQQYRKNIQRNNNS